MEDILGRENATEVAKRKTKIIEERAKLRSLFQRVFGTEDGKLALLEILKMSSALSVKDRSEEYTQRDEGQRRLAIGIASYVYGDEVELKLLEMIANK